MLTPDSVYLCFTFKINYSKIQVLEIIFPVNIEHVYHNYTVLIYIINLVSLEFIFIFKH